MSALDFLAGWLLLAVIIGAAWAWAGWRRQRAERLHELRTEAERIHSYHENMRRVRAGAHEHT